MQGATGGRGSSREYRQVRRRNDQILERQTSGYPIFRRLTPPSLPQKIARQWSRAILYSTTPYKALCFYSVVAGDLLAVVVAAKVAGDIYHDGQADPDPVKAVERGDDPGPLSSFKVRRMRTGTCSFVKMGSPRATSVVARMAPRSRSNPAFSPGGSNRAPCGSCCQSRWLSHSLTG
jgi:hypothetical protein